MDDLISRQAVKERTEMHSCDCISKEYTTEHIKACWINGRPKHSPELCEVLSWIDDVSPVQPEQKIGKWVTLKDE